MVLPLWIITENVDMAKWFVAAKRADFQKIGETFGISPVLARIIRNRDIVEEDDIRKYLQGTVEEMYDPGLLLGMECAVEILERKIREKQMANTEEREIIKRDDMETPMAVNGQ